MEGTDWLAIEREYRAGIRVLRDIAGEFGITEGAIRRKAKANDWTRDLSLRIKAKAESIIRKAQVRKEDYAKKYARTEYAEVKSAAELQAGAILQETMEIKRLSVLGDNLEGELGIHIEVEEGKPNVVTIDNRLGLEQKARVFKNLVDTREKIINLRRRNYGINDNAIGLADQLPPTNTMTPEQAYLHSIGKL